MNDSQKILHEFNRQRSRVLDMIAARPFPASHGSSIDHPTVRVAAPQPRPRANP